MNTENENTRAREIPNRKSTRLPAAGRPKNKTSYKQRESALKNMLYKASTRKDLYEAVRRLWRIAHGEEGTTSNGIEAAKFLIERLCPMRPDDPKARPIQITIHGDAQLAFVESLMDITGGNAPDAEQLRKAVRLAGSDNGHGSQLHAPAAPRLPARDSGADTLDS